MLHLINIERNNCNQIKETFAVNNKIKKVNFIYVKQDETLLDKFLTSLIFKYAKSNKIID